MRLPLSVLFSALTLLPLAATAHQYDAGDLGIDHPWARALPPVAPTGAAYLTIENRGTEADQLLGASTDIAEKTEIHEHVHRDGLMKMQEVQGLTIEPGQKVNLQPGGYHVMLFNLKRPLREGESFPLTLQFKRAGDVEVTVNIESEPPAASGADDGNHDHHHHH